ncbi:NUDIX domain-containing protein [Acinetobacter rudis]|uniref:ADP-ribose pyrophosphatase n=1 Tax=Acinetobacter rudis TaxID=632955 RepID=A0AAW8J650_9GAMM|nr:NUDIX domain-containing protein [Acinetobacter rudis]MDQ8934161.1 NUDIX domain-containing protein [Acinetobacter rudis]MDQ8954385.1 NUDIX domain-containing protein [Acinetobacter rudis]MDQ9016531.1 NUDIX domain-containing protein [Acinetobacter rudis]
MGIIHNASFGRNDVTIEKTETIFKGFLHIERVSLRHRLFDQTEFGPQLTREIVHRKQAAGVILYDHQQQKFALIEQFRIGAIQDSTSAWQLEVIAGILDGDETAEDCIQREAIEESGCQAHNLQHLFSFYPSAGACDEIFHLYSASTTLPLEGGIFGLETEGENIKLHIIDYKHLDQLLNSQRLRNAPVIMALQWLKQHLLTSNMLQGE